MRMRSASSNTIEMVMLGVTRLTQMKAGVRISTLRQQSKIRDAAVHDKVSKIRWAGDVMRPPQDKSRQRLDSAERKAHNRKTIDPMVRLLHEVLERTI
ncbi:hypothetical protein Y032_0036g3266 [Ancylostoma ceylanicum]|uniref:Uncharacterized protein n=1 Tax=Ancylostoma ceylanicum TaxID=53326 RepID=A0A016UJU4_9BILA|nr:hypothetical protein Y032_0036g3266 [Ancylostoma ceylanicum]